jgi:hypothetical protein
MQKENPLSQLRQKIEERKRRKLVKMEGHISQDPDFRLHCFRLIKYSIAEYIVRYRVLLKLHFGFWLFTQR